MTPELLSIRRELEAHTLTVEQALARLVPIARNAPLRAARVDGYRLLGEIAGRAFEAPWEMAERAAWALLEMARHTDAPVERRRLVLAMGRGFRNLWLMPFVHARLADEDPEMAAAAVAAAGGLGFAGLEEAVASRFLDAEVAPSLRSAAIAALGRMGAVSAVAKLVAIGERADVPTEAAAAWTALTEIHSPDGCDAAAKLLEYDPPREVVVATVRYLSEMGRLEVLPSLRRLARDDDAELRMVAGFAARALKAERARDAAERILAALTEKDRAVRAVLARRLRTLPVAEVLATAAELLADEPEGVVQILGEVRTAEVTRYLLALSERADLPASVRARALGSVEANEPWEREALAKVIADAKDPALRAAAAQTMGAFATVEEVFRWLGPLADDPSPLLRGALPWALQLAARPEKLSPKDRAASEKALKKALGDPDAFVRRRAAYVAGNLHLAALAADLAALAKEEETAADLRVAAFTGLGEIASPTALDALVGLWKREEDPQALAAAGRAIAHTLELHEDAKIDLARVSGKLLHLMKSDDATAREAAVRLAGLSRGAIPASALLPLATATAGARVREAALTALGRLGAPEAESALLAAMDDPDPALHERAAEALLAVGGGKSLDRLLEYVSGEEDGGVRARVAARLAVPMADAARAAPLLDAALSRLRHDDPATEPLLALKVKLLEQKSGGAGGGASVDAAIVAVFPTYVQLSKVRGFEPLNRSLRTAEALYRTAAGIADADCSPPIMLWMKCLEGYVHAWLAPQLSSLQREPMMLCEHVDRLLGDAWPTYQRYLADRWVDPVDVGGTKVEVPLRSIGNALREFQERRTKRLESPLSVTEWARMMLFFAVDHPSGVRNVFKVSSKSADHVVRIAHRLQTLAGVRNIVTHRAAAGAATVEAFRKAYYAAFEELTKLA
jgi:HEAT repeat protein